MGSYLIRRDTEEKTVRVFFPVLEVEQDVEKELLHSGSDWACMEDKRVCREKGRKSGQKVGKDNVVRHQINPEELAPDQTLFYEVISVLSYIFSGFL